MNKGCNNSIMKHSCRYVLIPSNGLSTGEYCDKPVGYKIVKDDDRNSRRIYSTFCDKHKSIVEKEIEEFNPTIKESNKIVIVDSK